MGHEGGDEALIRSLGEDPAAFEAFYRAHVKGITRYLARCCRTPEDVADAVAATFLAVLTSAYDPTLGPTRAWAYTIARNEAVRLYQKERHRTQLRVRLQGRRLLSPDDAERIAEMIDAEREAARIEPLLQTASPAERVFVRELVDTDDSPANVSRSLGITPVAGRVRLTRLRQRIKSQLERETSDPSPCHAEGGPS